ncbi:MAG TPA: CRISPR-associated RAMP protein Csx7 [Ktedonobacteraceae bacterium]|jgi:CRISPR-associated RAMP protein (TIGR02581 family)|nr:CRISPR-associated RAMP protein Csx7 [Ktedonobacteraceae bacterium]
MLKKLVNEAYCRVRITTAGPLLVRSGQATISGPDLTPVLTLRNGKREIFLPGSSLKGVFRSHIEKIVCSLKQQVVCYPFIPQDEQERKRYELQGDHRKSCSGLFTDLSKRGDEMRKKLEDRTDLVYKASCPTCRLFGSTGFIGRIAIGDAHLVSASQTELRDGVGIDRMTGGASHGAKFELEVVSTGVTFETDIHLRNFEIWQLGMFFVVMQDLQDGLIHIGSGRSRGLGKVTAQISTEPYNGQPGGFITSTLRDSKEHETELWGLGRWLNDNSYGTSKDDLLREIPIIEKQARSIRSLRSFQGENLTFLQNASTNHFIERMQQWPDQQALTAELVG